MIAKIKNKGNSPYTTNVLAIQYSGWKSKAIVFNREKNHILCLKIWFPHRIFFVIDGDKTDWIQYRNWEGFDWLVQNLKIMKKLTGGFLRENQPIPIFELVQAKTLAIDIQAPEWNEIKTSINIESLYEVSMGFHDSIIENMKINDSILEIDFDTTWGCHIILKCFEPIDYHLDRLGMIYEANLEINNDVVNWFVVAGYTDDWENDIPSNNWFIKAKKIDWKLVIE